MHSHVIAFSPRLQLNPNLPCQASPQQQQLRMQDLAGFSALYIVTGTDYALEIDINPRGSPENMHQMPKRAHLRTLPLAPPVHHTHCGC